MYGYGGCPTCCCHGYNDGFGNNWIWIIIVIFIVIFLFRDNEPREICR